jgi:hypothetical protein
MTAPQEPFPPVEERGGHSVLIFLIAAVLILGPLLAFSQLVTGEERPQPTPVPSAPLRQPPDPDRLGGSEPTPEAPPATSATSP